jgi:hypothetical protein
VQDYGDMVRKDYGKRSRSIIRIVAREKGIGGIMII